MVAFDCEGNVSVARYSPSQMKTVLFRAKDGRLEGTVRGATAIEPLPVYGARLLSPAAAIQGKKQRMGLLLPTSTGGLSAMVAVDPSEQSRLQVLQALLRQALPSAAGGNKEAAV